MQNKCYPFTEFIIVHSFERKNSDCFCFDWIYTRNPSETFTDN